MLNKRRNFYMAFFLLILMCYGCKGEKSPFSIPHSSERQKNITLLYKLISEDESERFKVVEEAKKVVEKIKVSDLEGILTSLRPKNVSTLIFVFMERQRDTLYKLSFPARKTIESSQGSFPNIAYYYARVKPKKGLPEVLRLFSEYGQYRNQVCKAIGEVSTPDALNFLLLQARAAKKNGEQILAFLGGLQAYRGLIGSEEILFFLDQHLNREEIIMLAKLETELSQEDLLNLWKGGNQKKLYAIEHIFGNLGNNFEALKFIVDYELEHNQWDYVRQLMQADTIRRSEDEYIKKYREKLLLLLHEKQMDLKQNIKQGSSDKHL